MKDTRVHQHVNQHACTGVPLLSWCLPCAGMSTCCQRSPLPGLALVFCGLPGGSRERRAARGGDLLLLLVTSVQAPLAVQPRWCAPAAGGDARPRPSGQQQCPPYCRAGGPGQPLNICCALKWGRGLAGKQGEARSSVCASFMKRLLLEPRESGGGLIGISLQKE